MKRILVLLVALNIAVLPLHAQRPKVPAAPREAVAPVGPSDPAAAAMRESQRLQQALGLDARQTRKVYKLFYGHFKKETPQAPGVGMPHGKPGEPGRPGTPGMGPGGPGGPGRMAGMGHPGGMGPGEHRRPADLKTPGEDPASWRATLEKKFRKIFTAEQYAAWLRLTPAPPVSHSEAPRP